jgi:invasion protein IalB
MSLRSLTSCFALSLGLLALPAFAQETAPAEAPAEAPAADAGLSMGTETNAPPAMKTKDEATVGEAYLAANFELWEQRCERAEAGTDPCQLFQLLRDGDGNAVAEFSIFALPAGGKAVAGATIVAPLETLLTANLTIAIDTGKAKVYPFTFCTQLGCVARVGFTAEEIAQFKAGAKATMTIVPAVAPEEKVNLDISLKGFTAGYDAVAASLAQ